MPRNNLVLLVIGALMLAKALWVLISPDSFRKSAAWWLTKMKHVNTLSGYVYILIGVAILVLVLLDQPLVNWLLVALGAGSIYAGSWLFNMERVEKTMKSMVLNRGSITLRIIGVLSLLITALVIWVAFKPVS
ncbi:MAG: hypothetical protein KAI74_07680 [Kiritimatiellae bacterium]|nr:hypothetical protein [Kiritimatiellia bacterium]